ncbi:MAG: MotA/TolQ/ExbB proton channel family protein [Firmicutes bacterium]|nr:MotA/TolQ/ExbB proton channel family protein [Bacillota bacterium]
MVDMLVKGGPVMIPLVVCSIIALAVVIERILYLLRTNQDPNRALRLISLAIERDRMVDAVAAVHKIRGQIGTLAATAIAGANRTRNQVEAQMQAAGEREIFLLERRLPILEMIITVSPLLGLLGTVLGLIKNFHVLAMSPQFLEAGALSSGIAEALITTAAGLSIAVAAYLLYVSITGAVDKRIREMNEFATNVVNLLMEGVQPYELSLSEDLTEEAPN